MTTTHTNLRLVETNNTYKATEPAADNGVWGRGETPYEAIQNYAEALAFTATPVPATDGGDIQSSYRMECDRCGTAVSMAAHYCKNCGQQLRGDSR